MVVVEADRNYVQPFDGSDIDIYSGETYSVLFTADQDPDQNSWILVGVRGRKPVTPQGLTLLNYVPTLASMLPVSLQPVAPGWDSYYHGKALMTSILSLSGSAPPPRTSDRRNVLLNTQNKINGHMKWSINVSLAIPSTPHQGSIKYGVEGAFDRAAPPKSFPRGSNVMVPPANPNSTSGNAVYTFAYNSTIDIVLQNANVLSGNVNEIHPWHLHGYECV